MTRIAGPSRGLRFILLPVLLSLGSTPGLATVQIQPSGCTYVVSAQFPGQVSLACQQMGTFSNYFCTGAPRDW